MKMLHVFVYYVDIGHGVRVIGKNASLLKSKQHFNTFNKLRTYNKCHLCDISNAY